MPKQLLDQLIDLSEKYSADRVDIRCYLKNTKNSLPSQVSDVSRIIEMAWEDRTPFEAIEYQYGLTESAVIQIMRQHIHKKSFKLWRKRVSGRKTKHRELRPDDMTRAYCPTQYKHR